MAAWRYEISLLVLKKHFTRSLRSLVKYFSTLEEKFRISSRPCNIFYLLLAIKVYWMFQKFGPIVNCILRKAFNASLSKFKLIQVRNLSK